MQKLNLLVFTIFSLLISLISTVYAANRPGIHPRLSDDFNFNLGWFFANTGVNARADGIGNGIGNDIDFENDLNLSNKQDVFLASVKWRFTEKFYLSYEFLDLRQSASAVLNKDINWKDYTFNSGSRVDSNFNLQMNRIFVGYSFLQSKKYELGAGLGLHLMNIDAKLSGSATVNGFPIGDTIQAENILAPLPNLGLYGAYAFTPTIISSARADWFSATVNDIEGSLTSFALDVQYQPFKHFGIGAGYYYLKVDIATNTSDWKGKIDYSYDGPKVFLSFNF